MKTADGNLVLRNAGDGKIVTRTTNNNHKKSSINSKEKASARIITTTETKIRPTQFLVSKNEGNTLSSWLRDIATLCLPFYILYMLATHPLIKDVGRHQNLTKMQLYEKVLHEYKQKLDFEKSVKKYNFLRAISGRNRCFEFPKMEFTHYVPPPLKGIFMNRYTRIHDEKGRNERKQKPQGIIVKSRRKIMVKGGAAKQAEPGKTAAASGDNFVKARRMMMMGG